MKCTFLFRLALPKSCDNCQGTSTMTRECTASKALIPATGTADAPRAFNLKLTRVLSDHGYQQNIGDPELETKHVDSKLQSLVARHVAQLQSIRFLSVTYRMLPRRLAAPRLNRQLVCDL